jgi:hypothetical protein
LFMKGLTEPGTNNQCVEVKVILIRTRPAVGGCRVLGQLGSELSGLFRYLRRHCNEALNGHQGRVRSRWLRETGHVSRGCWPGYIYYMRLHLPLSTIGHQLMFNAPRWKRCPASTWRACTTRIKGRTCVLCNRGLQIELHLDQGAAMQRAL